MIAFVLAWLAELKVTGAGYDKKFAQRLCSFQARPLSSKDTRPVGTIFNISIIR
ncbi:MAG: hypothetical protein ACRC67_07695 [Inquilinus sp.]|uniref:hypothetical protein n=1 Tax=Inquilinus sp. TaxID=1932117 RepID=UPI003F413115